MCVFKSRLTVCFDPPFWVGLYQREDGEGLRVCQVVFGGEPRDQEVLDYFQSHWRELKFSPPAGGGPDPDRSMNPKRARREARKAVQPTGTGTKAQRALQLQREQSKAQRTAAARERREEQRERKLARRQEKRREKHKGH